MQEENEMDNNEVIKDQNFRENIGNRDEDKLNERKEEGVSDIDEHMSYESYMTTALSYLEQLNEAVHEQDERIHSLNQSLPILNTLLKDQPPSADTSAGAGQYLHQPPSTDTSVAVGQFLYQPPSTDISAVTGQFPDEPHSADTSATSSKFHDNLEEATSCSELLDNSCETDEEYETEAQDMKNNKENMKENEVEGAQNDSSNCKTENKLNKMQKNHNLHLVDEYMKLFGNTHRKKRNNYAILTKPTDKRIQNERPCNKTDAQCNQVYLVSSTGQLLSDNVKQSRQLNRTQSYVSDTVNNPVSGGANINNTENKSNSGYKRRLSLPTYSSINKKIKSDDLEQNDQIPREDEPMLVNEKELGGNSQCATEGTSYDTRKQRFLKTQEALKDSGLLQITMKTAELLNKQMIIDAEIEKLKICAAKFLQSVLNSHKMSCD